MDVLIVSTYAIILLAIVTLQFSGEQKVFLQQKRAMTEFLRSLGFTANNSCLSIK